MDAFCCENCFNSEVLKEYPQTNGKIERYHRTLRGEVGLVSYDMPSELEAAIRPFVHYSNNERYHEGISTTVSLLSLGACGS